MSKGFNLQLNHKQIPSFSQENEVYQGSDIKLFFKLPNGQILENTFKTNQDVEWAKNFISKQCGFKLNDISLEFEGKQMINILSLSDIKNLADQSEITVQLLNKENQQKAQF